MNILLIQPKFPDTYWSFKHALRFVSKTVNNIPLGLITVASMLPEEWIKQLVDLNFEELKEKKIGWADYVFISALSVQMASVRQIIDLCKKNHTRIVAGGPLFSDEPELFRDIDHLVLNEAEITLPRFLEDLESGSPKRIYSSSSHADISGSPAPDYSLLKLNKYYSAGIQYTRGCPYDCEFCDITARLGRKVRSKSPMQIINELDRLLECGWKGNVFFVDDNFIGQKQKLKRELLPELIRWMRHHNYPFIFITEATINLSDDPELMQLMVQAGFSRVFVGIETPDEVSLAECNKMQNHNRDLIKCVQTIQEAGIEVSAGFIVGFDNDQPDIFQRQVDFIQKSGIITAMVGLLNAPSRSRLYQRLQEEGRLLHSFTGDNTDYSINFIPAMGRELLLEGYNKIVNGIYASKPFYERIKTFLEHYNPAFKTQTRVTWIKFIAFLKSIIYIGIFNKKRVYYWQLIIWSIRNKPKVLPLAVTYSIFGYHFRKVYRVLN
jgi:radical SAM superfamily enzyme YgiQ (UPF0313 family)